jgi:AcrR family transcriptional regulator
MTETERRNPVQQRSQERVDAIFEAVSVLIIEQGLGELKMAAIAKTAGISKASIYQYFPNTSAIIRALAEDYAERFRQVLTDKLNQVDSVDALINHSSTLFYDLWSMYQAYPVLKAIGLATSLDKGLQEMDVQDSRKNADLLFDAYKDYVGGESWDELKRVLFLVCHLSGSAIRLALALDEKEGEAILMSYQQLMKSRLMALL